MLELRASHLRRNNSRERRSMVGFDSDTRAHDARQHYAGPQAIPAYVPHMNGEPRALLPPSTDRRDSSCPTFLRSCQIDLVRACERCP